MTIGYLSPDGKHHPCAAHEHEALAAALSGLKPSAAHGKKKGPFSTYVDNLPASEAQAWVHERGFIHIDKRPDAYDSGRARCTFWLPRRWTDDNAHMTDAQVAWLRKSGYGNELRKRRSDPAYRAQWLAEFGWTDAVDRRDDGSETSWSSNDDVFQMVRYLAERGAMNDDMIRALSVFMVSPPAKGAEPFDPWAALWTAACDIRRDAVIAQKLHAVLPWDRVRAATDVGVESFRRFVDNAPRKMSGDGWEGEAIGWSNVAVAGIVDGLPFLMSADRYWMNGFYTFGVADRPDANPEDIDDTMGWETCGSAPDPSSGLARGRTLSVAAAWQCVREGIDRWRRRNDEPADEDVDEAVGDEPADEDVDEAVGDEPAELRG